MDRTGERRKRQTMASGALSGLVRPIGNRAVHLRLHPRVETLAESREILRLLQQFGRVDVFRNFKYDALSMPNTMIAMFETEEAAQKLLEASPLRFVMRPEESAAPQPRHYQLQVNASTFHHRDQIDQNAYNGAFKVSTRCLIQEDLVKKVPMPGLSEFTLRKEEKPWRVLQWEKYREDSQTKTLRQLLEEATLPNHSDKVRTTEHDKSHD
ncbi:hypothetical protein D6D06_01449 [Aureobasidium pullulans]|nr:hypothetical protein D6D06_01449 [Aureobasidium pullulans]